MIIKTQRPLCNYIWSHTQAKMTKSIPLLANMRNCSFLTNQSFVVQLFSHIRLFVNSWITARQSSLFFTISWSLLELKSIESGMLSNDLILCCPLLLLPSVFPNFRVFSNELALHQMTNVLGVQLQHQSFQWMNIFKIMYIIASIFWQHQIH